MQPCTASRLLARDLESLQPVQAAFPNTEYIRELGVSNRSMHSSSVFPCCLSFNASEHGVRGRLQIASSGISIFS